MSLNKYRLGSLADKHAAQEAAEAEAPKKKVRKAPAQGRKVVTSKKSKK